MPRRREPTSSLAAACRAVSRPGGCLPSRTTWAAKLTGAEDKIATELFGRGFENLSALRDLTVLDDRIRDAIANANSLCGLIRQDKPGLQPYMDVQAPRPVEDGMLPAVRRVGFGDLVLAREQLLGFQATDIAYIENVLPRETRVREHTHKHEQELTVEQETTREDSRTKDLQTTDRYELQTQSQRVIEQKLSASTDLWTSGSYGLTSVVASFEADYSMSKKQAQSASAELAKEIVSKSVNETRETTRELRRRRTLDAVTEFNRHGIDFAGRDESFSGIYRWVEKIHEVELRHYGTRLMLEFYVPEPGLSLLTDTRDRRRRPETPPVIDFGPQDIDETNYLCLAQTFGAYAIEPPPAQTTNVHYVWASQPLSEDKEMVRAEGFQDLKAESIVVPDGYVPGEALITVSTLTSGPLSSAMTEVPQRDSMEPYRLDLHVALAGRTVIRGLAPVDDEPIEFHDFGEGAFPQIPVTIRVFDHANRTAAINMIITCDLTNAGIDAWRLRVYEQLKEAEHVTRADYHRRLAEAAFGADGMHGTRSPADNRRVEQDEIRKWCVKALRLEAIDQDAVVKEGRDEELQLEVDPLRAVEDAPLVSFYEQAFDWPHLSASLYPYFWGRRSLWDYRLSLVDPDPRHAEFLRAGAARVLVPVIPGFEERVLHYLTSAGAEVDKVSWLPDGASVTVPATSAFEDVWAELMVQYHSDRSLGSGTLSVLTGEAQVTVNDDSLWIPDTRDLGREVFVDGIRYTIVEVLPDRACRLDRAFEGSTDPRATYVTGSVPYGESWRVAVPTPLVILDDQKAAL